MPDTAVATRPKRKSKCRPKRSTEDRATVLAVLDANRGNYSATETQTGVPEQTIRYWNLVLCQRDATLRDLRAEKRDELASAATDVAWEALLQARARIHEASSRDAAVTFGIFNQHAMLLRGQPTHIHAQSGPLAHYSAEQLHALRGALDALAAARAPKDVTPQPGCDDTGLSLTGEVNRGEPVAEVVEAQPQRGADAPGRVEAGPVQPPGQLPQGLLAHAAQAGERGQGQAPFGAERQQQGAERQGAGG